MTQTDDNQFNARNWQSVRTVLEGLILLGVIYLGNSSLEQAKATVELKVKVASVSDTLLDLRTQLASIPAMSQGMARIEVKLDEHERRISQLEHPQR